jgi:formylmethanofuran dehydrogenase subunit C
MQSGELFIHGDAGDDLGASMRGGRIHVHGSAGHRIGGPEPTSDRGMTGGEIVIDGDVGDLTGVRMRRGLIAVRGRAGASPGYRMIAGTVVVGHGKLEAPGLEMRRGTVLGLDRSAAGAPLGGHVAEAGTIDAALCPVIRLLLRRLADLGWVVDPAAMTGRYRLAAADRFELGKGEIWQWVS